MSVEAVGNFDLVGSGDKVTLYDRTTTRQVAVIPYNLEPGRAWQGARYLALLLDSVEEVEV